MNGTIGIYYELPDKRVAYTYGFDGRNKTISYYFDDGKGGHVASDDEFQTWTPRKDLRDFPNARDPRLPYVFDLLWDIKHLSELRAILKYGHEDIHAIKNQMMIYEILA